MHIQKNTPAPGEKGAVIGMPKNSRTAAGSQRSSIHPAVVEKAHTSRPISRNAG